MGKEGGRGGLTVLVLIFCDRMCKLVCIRGHTNCLRLGGSGGGRVAGGAIRLGAPPYNFISPPYPIAGGAREARGGRAVAYTYTERGCSMCHDMRDNGGGGCSSR